MAIRGAAARRYAQAVFDIAKETNSLDRWLTDLQTVSGIFGSQVAITALEDPSFKLEDQRKIVTQLLAKQNVSPIAVNLLYMLVDRQRLALLPRIVETFQELYNRDKGIVVADVTSAIPLDAAQQQRVVAELTKITGKTIQLRVHQDPTILGGLITRIGDELIDASVATRLATLSERLS